MQINLTDEQRATLRRCLCVCIEQMMDGVYGSSWPVVCQDALASWLESGGDGEVMFPGGLGVWRRDIYYLAEMLGEWPLSYGRCVGWRPITLAQAADCLAPRDPSA